MKKLLLLLIPAALLGDVFVTKPAGPNATYIDGVASSASVDAALALKHPLEDQRLSTTNDVTFASVTADIDYSSITNPPALDFQPEEDQRLSTSDLVTFDTVIAGDWTGDGTNYWPKTITVSGLPAPFEDGNGEYTFKGEFCDTRPEWNLGDFTISCTAGEWVLANGGYSDSVAITSFLPPKTGWLDATLAWGEYSAMTADGFIGDGSQLSLLTLSNSVFVAKTGSDAADGSSMNTPVQTLTNALAIASDLITGGATGVRVHVLDGGTYTENITVPNNVILDAKGIALAGTVEISGGSEVWIDHQVATANNQNLVTMIDATDGPGIYNVNVIDGRDFTGVTLFRNVGGGGKNMFLRAGIAYVGESGFGVTDTSIGFGHIHLNIPDLYLAGDNATGIRAIAQGIGATDIVGYMDHILTLGAVTNCTGIVVSNSAAIVKLNANEIRMDGNTAYNITAGSLYLVCPKITGTRTGTPVFELSEHVLGTVPQIKFSAVSNVTTYVYTEFYDATNNVKRFIRTP